MCAGAILCPYCACADAGVSPPGADRTRAPAASRAATPVAGSWGVRLAWVSGLVLTVSAFTDWYVGTLPNGLTLAVTGWHTGTLGKLVFFVGLATLILEASRAAGILLPAACRTGCS